jgi:hypothetical protein
MTRFLYWRKMTWAILVWSVAVIVWMIAGGAVMASFLVWSFGTVVLTLLWFSTRPLWRQGHGARIRRLRSSESASVRSFETLSTGH